MTDTLTTIPLDKLAHARANVRKTEPKAALDELMASIEALGVLQSLTVRPQKSKGTKKNAKPNGAYEVLAGGRRLRALKALAAKRRIPRDYPVPCQIRSEGDATELSLAENAVREALHPADQFEAFKRLHDEGQNADEIAARFGVTPLVVRQRLKLAAVSPQLIECYRKGEMDLDQLMAFTVTDDIEAQERVWFEGPFNDERPQAIRRALTAEHVDGTDRRARFIGAEAYEAAGGEIVRDLFKPDDDPGYFTDSELLDRLVAETLESEAKAVQAEGWSWVEVFVHMDYEHLARMGRLEPVVEPNSDENDARLKACTDRYDALVEEHGEDPPEEVFSELEAFSDEIDRLSQPVLSYKAEGMARAGAILSLDYQGAFTVERGLIRPEDMPNSKKTKSKTRKKAEGNGMAPIPDVLVEELTAHRTAALQETLAGNPSVALDALVHALVLACFYHRGEGSCVGIKPSPFDPRRIAESVEASSAVAAFGERIDRWRETLPEPDGLWGWLTEQNRKTKLELLACCVAMTVNAVRTRRDLNGDGRLHHADTIATAVNLDMTKWWNVSESDYLGRVAKPRILAAVTEAVTPQAAENIAGMKKVAMATRANELLADSKWLPEPLRAPGQVTEQTSA